MNLQPLRDKILVRPEQRIQSTIYFQSAEAESRGIVMAVGPEAQAEGLNVGDKIAFGTFHKEFKHNDERLLKMSWQDVCFVMEE